MWTECEASVEDYSEEFSLCDEWDVLVSDSEWCHAVRVVTPKNDAL